MIKDEIFESYVDGIIAFDSGLVTAAQYIFEDTLILSDNFYAKTQSYHPSHTAILENLAKSCISNKNYDKALVTLNRAREIEPNNLRILHKLFFFHADILPNEKLALEIYLAASEIYERLGEHDINNEIFKSMRHRGEMIKKDRKTYLLMKESSQYEKVEAQNLMKQLPIEILSEIFKLLNSSDLNNLLSVCKSWRMTILESPYLIGIFNFQRHLTYHTLESYLRLFDQKVPISEVTVDNIILNMSSMSEQRKIYKLLLASKLKCKSFNYTIDDDFKIPLTKMIKESKSQLFQNLIQLKINVLRKHGALNIIPLLLSFTSNLKILYIKIDLPRTRSRLSIFKTKVRLPKLEELDICCRVTESLESMIDFPKYLDAPNLQKLSLESTLRPILYKFSKNTWKLKHLKLYKTSINGFLRDYLSENNTFCEYLEHLEKLEFEYCSVSSRSSDIPLELYERKPFASLKTLSFERSPVSMIELNCFLECTKATLNNLYICERPHLNYPDPFHGTTNDLPEFSMKILLETMPHLERFKLSDDKINSSIFSTLMFEIAMLSKAVRLKFLEFSSEFLNYQHYMVLFLSIKGKLYIDHLRISCIPTPQLKTFIDKAILDGEVKKVETFSLSRS